MTLTAHYEAAIAQADISDDPLQRQMLVPLQRLADELVPAKHVWLNLGRKKKVMGIYLYGPVGAGKTFLMDLFYQSLAEPHKVRFHFHHFMQQIDTQLRCLQGQEDPLRIIAANFAKSTRLLFLDEFLVNDIADAMILAGLLKALLAQDVVLVATSNTRPDDLYLNGLQRARFLPAIEMIKTNCQVLVLADHRDYRLGRTPLLQSYLSPINDATDHILAQQFGAIAINIDIKGALTIQNRLIPYVKCGERAIWFEFSVICNLPRSQLDYLELANRFDTIFVSDIPALTSTDTVGALLLTHFIDVMYDQGVRLIISAAVPIEQLYAEGEVRTSFQRTLSRLEEMQSVDYLRRHPRRD